MKKIKLTEAGLNRLITKVLKEQKPLNFDLPKPSLTEQEEVDHVETHDEDVDTIDNRILALEERLNELEADYVRKIGYGDHHDQSHTL